MSGSVRSTRVGGFAAGTVLAVLLLAPAIVAAGSRGTIRFGAGYVAPTGDLSGQRQTRFSIGVLTLFAVDNRYEVEPGESLAPFASFELRVNDRLGVELGLSAASTDLDVDITRDFVVTDNDTREVIGRFTETSVVPGEADFTLATLGLNVHLLPRRRFDLYVAPLVGYVLYDDARFEPSAPFPSVDVGLEDDFAFGAALGLDVPLGSGKWHFATKVRVLRAETRPERIPRVYQTKFFAVDDEAPGKLPIDPVEVTVGLARSIGRRGG